MSWRQRLGALVIAGGALVVAGCADDGPAHGGADMAIGGDMSFVFVCNANPDPCCLHPTGPSCPSDGGAHD